jgi:hypothetical protein
MNCIVDEHPGHRRVVHGLRYQRQLCLTARKGHAEIAALVIGRAPTS